MADRLAGVDEKWNDPRQVFSNGNPGVLMHQVANRLTVRHLRLIAAIVAEGNLQRAAEALNMTQSAVTKALQDAEGQMGVQLFERTNRGVVPTTFGSSLAAHARLILAQIGKAEQELTDLRDGSSGHVTIGTLLAGSAGLLPEAIVRLRRDRPRLVIKVEEATNDVLMPALRAGELDLVLGRLPEFRDRDGLKQELLMNDCAQIVARRGHPLASRTGIGLADLLACDWILPGSSTTLRRQFDKAFRDQNLDPPLHSVETVSFLTTRGLLQATDYLGVWPVQLARQEIATGSIVALPVPLPTTARPIGITTRADDRMLPAAASLVACLRAVAAEGGFVTVPA
ncbi:LysR family transcriptional regulator [Gemmobacter denitrificans]|uniref:LysR family transcriptional regulator n=1 Tax=Gemmobacter denitrificans TaxID=3123040 RepID=A0ABU8BYX6_9RHOB